MVVDDLSGVATSKEIWNVVAQEDRDVANPVNALVVIRQEVVFVDVELWIPTTFVEDFYKLTITKLNRGLVV